MKEAILRKNEAVSAERSTVIFTDNTEMTNTEVKDKEVV